MSSVERALKKLREAGGNDPRAPRRIAQVAAEGRSGPEEPVGARRTVEFDLNALREAGLYAEQNQMLAEQYRAIKRPLLAKAAEPTDDEPLNLVAVTSAVASEGKTFTAVNLALSLTTEKDWRVLLIDADCKNPQLSRLLGSEEQPGLLDVLKNDGLDARSAIMATSIPGLSVLPLGIADEHAPELLSSARMATVCAELAKSEPHRLVIFDSSPLLLTTEAVVVCARVGQVVMVVRADQTPQQAVLGALHKLEETKTIGFVLNCVNHAGDSFHYGSYGAYPYPQAGTQDVHEL